MVLHGSLARERHIFGVWSNGTDSNHDESRKDTKECPSMTPYPSPETVYIP